VFERFTSQARSVAVLAQQEARALGHPAVGTQHVLLGILGEPGGAGARALAALGASRDDVRARVERLVDQDAAPFTPEDAGALQSLGIDLDEVRRAAEEAFGVGALDRPAVRGGRARGVGGHIPFTAGSKKALELALREALHLGHTWIGTEHVLLGLVRDERCAAARILQARGIDPDAVRAAVLREIAAGGDRPGRTA
jgi:ATP-dependent Clp protease ATP-binding subunit ClpA